MKMMKLPKRITINLGAFQVGPNCWNATQRMFDNNIPLDFTADYEMIKWLEENTKVVKHPKVKDIVVFWRHGTLVHTAVRVGRRSWYHKIGYEGVHAIDNFKEVDRIYGRSGGHNSTHFEYRRFVKKKK